MRKLVLLCLPICILILNACTTQVSPYEEKMEEGIKTSLACVNDTSGLWDGAVWWHSANLLTAVIRYAEITESDELYPLIDDIFTKTRTFHESTDTLGVANYWVDYIGDSFDDEAWWALAWIEAYKLTRETQYLEMAEYIFDDMTMGWTDECGGGLYWNKEPLRYKNSISNNLFSLIALRLHTLTEKKEYMNWAEKEINWYLQSGMIDRDTWYIEDGTQDDCLPNRGQFYTYNQGVALAAFTEMYLYSNDSKYLDIAENIAKITIKAGGQMCSDNGILKERNRKIEKGSDGAQFKGIFVRHLAFLYNVTKNEEYKNFILKNADSIIATNYDPASKSFGHFWDAAFTEANPTAHSSALECVIEAYALTK